MEALDSGLFTISHQICIDRKRSLQSENADQKIARNIVFDCHLSPVRRQSAIKISVSNDF